jgi:hypothetical protein
MEMTTMSKTANNTQDRAGLSRRTLLRLAPLTLGLRGARGQTPAPPEPGPDSELIYRNPLASESDIAGFRMEGQAKVTFVEGRMRLENALDPASGQAANFVFWCPQVFPASVEIAWSFRPVREPGLAMLFFSASGVEGKDLFDPSLPARTGIYDQYHSGSINALHVSYFRRKWPEERAFHTCNLRKSRGFHLVVQGADPIPSVPDVQGAFRIKLLKKESLVRFSINDLPIFEWVDDGRSYGPALTGGRIGFRQMAPLVADYFDLVVRNIDRL